MPRVNLGNHRMYAVLLLLVAFAPTLALATTKYSVTDLGTLGGSYSSASGINNHGQVVGFSSASDGGYYPFLWQPDSGMSNLGTLGGLAPTVVSANDINDQGQVVGFAYTSEGAQHAFFWQSGTGMLDLGTLGGGSSLANAINAAGQVTGWTDTSSGARRAFRKQGGAPMEDLGTLGGDWSVGIGINNGGQIVGWSSTGTGTYRPCLWDAGARIDLGTLGGDDTALGSHTAWDINDAGQVVGNSLTASGYRHAFLWDHSFGMTDISSQLPSPFNALAQAINEQSTVVGRVYGGDPELQYAFRWTPEEGLVDLNALLDSSGNGWSLRSTYAINDSGQIVGSGSHDGASRAFLLTPVPEPSALVLVAIAALFAIHRR